MSLEINTHNLSHGGKHTSVAPSTALLNQKLVISPCPRMLAPLEVELLRQSGLEMLEVVNKKTVKY